MTVSDDRARHILNKFIADLNRVWAAVEPGSYQEFERMAANPLRRFGRHPEADVQPLPHSTTHAVLTEPRHRLPRWGFVQSLIAILRLIVDERDDDPDAVVGTLRSWKARHEEANARMRDARFAARAAARGAAGSSTAEEPNGSPRHGGSARGNGEEFSPGQVLALADLMAPTTWWYDLRAAVPPPFRIYLTLERAARLLRVYQPQDVPGLLRTAVYTAHRLRLRHPNLPVKEVTERIWLQERRQQVLFRDHPLTLWAMVDLSALEGRNLPAAVLSAQLLHLRFLCRLPHVVIQLIHQEHDHPDIKAAAGDRIRFLRFGDDSLPDMLCLDHSSEAIYPTSPKGILQHAQILDALAVSAEPPAATIPTLNRLLKQL